MSSNSKYELVKFKLNEHEVEERIPVEEHQVAHQSPDVVEECAAWAKRVANLLVSFGGDLSNGMQEKGKQIQRQQGGRETLLAMAEVVGDVVAMVLEHVVVFILGVWGATVGKFTVALT